MKMVGLTFSKPIFVLILITTLASTLQAKVLKVNGVYQGRNIYIQNPLISDGKYCAVSIYLNDEKIISEPKETSVEVDLSGLEVNEAVNIRIYHHSGCTPRVLNQYVIRPQSKFKFSGISIEGDQLKWETKGEKSGGEIHVQHHINGEWVDVISLNPKGSLSANNYIEKVSHLSGENRYRIRYTEPGGLEFRSDVVKHVSNVEKVDFYPRRVKDYITFNPAKPVKYLIIDMEGNKVKQGNSKVIDCRDLEGNKYYTLLFDNQKERFLKKK